MAWGIEARVPFLDHELVEYVLRLPPSLKIRGLRSKALLRRYASELLPRQVTSRRKMPFFVPLENYWDEPGFRDLVDDTLSERSVRERGIFRFEAVQRLREAVQKKEFVYAKQVMSLVILELWFRMAVDRRGTP